MVTQVADFYGAYIDAKDDPKGPALTPRWPGRCVRTISHPPSPSG
ncbi:hypothetical protein ACOZE3_28280 [Streptomyces cinereoruber]